MKKAKVEMVFQVGVVVNSVDEVVENLKKYFDFDESSIKIKSTLEMKNNGAQVENFYDGKPVEFYIKTARIDFGGIDLEYVEPLNKEGGDPYSDWLKEHGQGIHHVNMKLDDRTIIDKVMEENNVSPHVVSKFGDLALETYDFRNLFGFIAELGDMVVGPRAIEYYDQNKK